VEREEISRRPALEGVRLACFTYSCESCGHAAMANFFRWLLSRLWRFSSLSRRAWDLFGDSAVARKFGWVDSQTPGCDEAGTNGFLGAPPRPGKDIAAFEAG